MAVNIPERLQQVLERIHQRDGVPGMPGADPWGVPSREPWPGPEGSFPVPSPPMPPDEDEGLTQNPDWDREGGVWEHVSDPGLPDGTVGTGRPWYRWVPAFGTGPVPPGPPPEGGRRPVMPPNPPGGRRPVMPPNPPGGRRPIVPPNPPGGRPGPVLPGMGGAGGVRGGMRLPGGGPGGIQGGIRGNVAASAGGPIATHGQEFVRDDLPGGPQTPDRGRLPGRRPDATPPDGRTQDPDWGREGGEWRHVSDPDHIPEGTFGTGRPWYEWQPHAGHNPPPGPGQRFAGHGQEFVRDDLPGPGDGSGGVRGGFQQPGGPSGPVTHGAGPMAQQTAGFPSMPFRGSSGMGSMSQAAAQPASAGAGGRVQATAAPMGAPMGAGAAGEAGGWQDYLPQQFQGGQLYRTENNHYYLQMPDGSWYQASGMGQVEEAMQLYGAPEDISSSQVGQSSGSIVDFFGGPNRGQQIYEDAQQAWMDENPLGVNPPEMPDAPEDPGGPDFRERAKAMYPWMPNSLLDIFVDAWTDTGSADEAMQAMRSSPEYEQYFPGNRTDDGLVRMPEADYIAYQDQARQLFRQYGLPRGFYDDASDIGRFIENEMSLAELNERLGEGFHAAQSAPQEVRTALREYYGVSEGDLAAYFLNPEKAMPAIQRQWQTAQIGGTAQMSGFGRITQGRATRLAEMGVDATTAHEGFSTLQRNRELFQSGPGLRGGSISRAAQMDAVFEQDSDAQELIERRRDNRLASFGGAGGGAAASAEGIIGLN